MSIPSNITGFGANVGIETIMKSFEGPGAVTLPFSSTVLPSDLMTGQAQLHTLFASKWEHAMQSFLQPNILSRELLIPGMLASRLKRAKKELSDEARKSKSASIRQAVNTLEEEEDLQLLLDTYRNMLLQG